MVDATELSDVRIRIPLGMLNRHGLVAGATGTGKTKTLQLLAEQLQRQGGSRSSPPTSRATSPATRACPARRSEPHAVTSLIRTAGVDLVILQDGSASMHVTDLGRIAGSDRCGSSAARRALRWENDRVAMALFAHMATPQIRLTKDPNTVFLLSRSPGGEVAVSSRRRWHVGHQHRARYLLGHAAGREGRRLRRIASNAMTNKLPQADNAKAFVLISDGQAWSGEVAEVARAGARPRHPVERGRRRHDGGRHHSRSEARAEPADGAIDPSIAPS